MSTHTAPVTYFLHTADESECDMPDAVAGDPDTYCGHGFNVTEQYV